MITLCREISSLNEYWRDDRNNSWNAGVFSSQEVAEYSESMIDCRDCQNCHDLVNCVGCVNCYHCACCDHCFNCSGCFDCVSCDNCFNCADCRHCHHLRVSTNMYDVSPR